MLLRRSTRYFLTRYTSFDLLPVVVIFPPIGSKSVLFRWIRPLRPISLYMTGDLKRFNSLETNEFPKAVNASSVFTGFGASCSQGKLKENEDRFDNDKFLHGLSYFAVFDGHRGDFSSSFLKHHLGINLSKAFVCEDSLANSGQEVVRNAFDTCEKLLEIELQSSSLDQKTKDHNGSTALAVVTSNKYELLLAQTGDSRAVLCKSGEAICLTNDHTPNNELEAERIENNGGWIDWDTKLVPYVNGILSMTRSFGNCYLRNAGITHIPFVKYLNLDKDSDQFLVLCTDGVSDWMTDEEIVSIVSQFDDPDECAHELTCCARQYGSTDDATALVIPLCAWGSRMKSNSKEGVNFLRSTILKRD